MGCALLRSRRCITSHSSGLRYAQPLNSSVMCGNQKMKVLVGVAVGQLAFTPCHSRQGLAVQLRQLHPVSCKCRLGTKRILTRWLCAARGSLASPIYSRQGRCILLASLLGAIFGLRSGGAASAWVVSFCPCQSWAIKASSAISLCVAVVIVRAVRAAVV